MSTFLAQKFFALPRLALLLLAVSLLALAGCGGDAREIKLAPLSQMPDYVRNGPANVQEAYRFAVANPELVDKMPCYCGCGSVGHTSNLECYVKAFNADGSVAEFDNHAAL